MSAEAINPESSGQIPNWYFDGLDMDQVTISREHRRSVIEHRRRLQSKAISTAKNAHTASLQISAFDATGNLLAAVDHLGEENRHFSAARIELRDDIHRAFDLLQVTQAKQRERERERRIGVVASNG